MNKYALVLEYDGANYYGWQKQVSFISIQQVLEDALSKFANESISVVTAGRTDTGVHALYQVVSFTSSANRHLNGWVRGVNALLPSDIAVRDVAIVDNDFDARFSAISRTYNYYLYISKTRSAILNKKVGWYHDNLNIRAMQDAMKLLVGKMDYSAFRASSCQAPSPIREITVCDLFVSGNMLCFEITANAFLHHMIRNIVGALIYVGNGKLSINEFASLINSRDRKIAPPTFMPDGLYLSYVKYPYSLFKFVPQRIGDFNYFIK